MKTGENRITFRSFLLGALFSGVFAVLTVLLENRRDMCLTANQVPLLPYALLILTVLLVNPLCRLVRVIRRFSQAEILIIFVMCMVSSGVSTFGLAAQVVPVIGSLFNQHWNNEQTEWNRYVDPFLNEHFFLAEPGIRSAADEYRAARTRALALAREYEEALGREQDKAALKSHRLLIEEQQKVVDEKRAALAALERRAFEKVEVFRSGLPRGLRPFPGCLPVVREDDAGTYFSRLRRLVCGKRAAWHINSALDVLRRVPKMEIPDGQTAGRVGAMLGQAVDALSPAGLTGPIESTEAQLSASESGLFRDLAELHSRLARLNDEKRLADLGEARKLEKTINRLRRRADRIEREKARVAVARARNRPRLAAGSRVAAVVQRLRLIRTQVAGHNAPAAGDTVRALGEILMEFPALDASLRRYFLGDVPWSHWIRPLLNWGLLITLTYVVLMAFNVLIFRQWAHNEKLVYPLAELPQLLVRNDSGRSGVPGVFRNGLFWVGFAISAGVLCWNLLCRAGALPGMAELDLTNSWWEYVKLTALAGLGGARSSIFFTLIGLAFLIPKRVSFSLWFFWVLYLLQLLVMVWTGHGQNEGSFPCEWWYTLNFRTAEGGGALLVFASVVLFKCRKYLLCVFSPSSVSDLAEDERRELRTSSFLFLFCSLGLVLVLWRGLGVNPFYAVFGYAVFMVITVGLIRAVTEGGVLGFQAWVSPFHFIRHLFGFDRSWTSPSFMAPLMVYYAILFLDIKTFIAPAMANGLKIRHDLNMHRGRFHFAILVCMLVAVVTACVAAIMMSYSAGADSMHSWFYVGLPRSLFSRIADMAKAPPTATASGRFWLGFGGVVMAALLYFRQRLFWLPHPIGMIMLVNPIMGTFWFSIFLGWLAKSAVTKYGNKDTYAKAQGLFVGLIVGELVLVVAAMIVSLAVQKNLGIDLNRN